MPHAGFDRSAFPGAAKMAALKSTTNLKWCGFYLAPSPSHPNTGWMPTRATLVAQGWGIAPIFVGQQTTGPGSHVVTKTQGTLDGKKAVQLMLAAGFPPGTFVYLDLENGPPFPNNQKNYVAAWAQEVTNSATFNPGVYCSHLLAGAVHALVPSARLWVFKVPTTAVHSVAGPNYPAPSPAGSGVSGAFMWQRDQNAKITVSGTSLVVDLNTAQTADPGI